MFITMFRDSFCCVFEHYQALVYSIADFLPFCNMLYKHQPPQAQFTKANLLKNKYLITTEP